MIKELGHFVEGEAIEIEIKGRSITLDEEARRLCAIRRCHLHENDPRYPPYNHFNAKNYRERRGPYIFLQFHKSRSIGGRVNGYLVVRDAEGRINYIPFHLYNPNRGTYGEVYWGSVTENIVNIRRLRK